VGFESATKGNNVFRDLVLARIIEATSTIDAERVLFDPTFIKLVRTAAADFGEGFSEVVG
jgi:hypothetical protein